MRIENWKFQIGSGRTFLFLKRLKKIRTVPLEALFELFSAIAVRAGPRFGAVKIAAIPAAVSVFDTEEFEIFLPVRAFFGEWRGAKAGLDPVRRAIFGESRLFHVVDIFVAGDGTLAEGAFADGAEQGEVLAGFDSGFD